MHPQLWPPVCCCIIGVLSVAHAFLPRPNDGLKALLWDVHLGRPQSWVVLAHGSQGKREHHHRGAGPALLGHAQVKQGTKDDHHEERYEQFEPLADVFALGDCCANVKTPLPSLAQVGTAFGMQGVTSAARGSSQRCRTHEKGFDGHRVACKGRPCSCPAA